MNKRGIAGVVVLIAILAGCKKSPTAAEIALSGEYILESQNGRAVPFPLSPPTATDPCPVGVAYGELSLGPVSSDFPASYHLGAVSERVCQPDGLPGETSVVVADAGFWSGNLSRLTFRSSPSFRCGTYEVGVLSSSGAPKLTLTLQGNEYVWRLVRPYPPSLLSIEIAVVGPDGAQVPGALIRIRSSDGIVTRAGSTVFRTIGAGVAEGPATVAVAPPPGYTFAPSQPNPVTVTPTRDQLTKISFRLVRTGS